METKFKKPKAILTFDLEFWWNNPIIEDYLPKKKDSLVDYTEESTTPLLRLLAKYQIKATFFVLGKLAQNHPDLIEEIFRAGHEIASHGYSHRSLYDLDKASFDKEIKLTNQILKSIIGVTPKGFRAPNFSLNQKTRWTLDVLEENGFKYDSSIFPAKTPLYGVYDAPLGIHKISQSLIEMPVSVYQLAKLRMPMAGGFYFRVIPTKLCVWMIASVAQKRIPVLYFHPRELYELVPKMSQKIPWLRRKIHFHGTKNAFSKLEVLFQKFDFIGAKDYLTNNI